MIIPKLPINIPKLPSLPEIELSPIPELIFLSTVKGAISFVFNLSLLDLSLILIIILLVNVNPPVRQKTAVALSLLLLIFGLQISCINVYALLCSWLSPSTTLEPLTVVTLGILNGMMPILTDTILLTHIVIERLEHSKSRLRLAMTMAAPVFLKFGRLANAAIYTAVCAEFVLNSIISGDGTLDMDALNAAAQARSMEISSVLHMVDNSYHLILYYMNAFEQRRKAIKGLALSATSTTPTGLLALLLASGGNFLLPILLSAAQLAVSRRWPDSDIPRDIECVKVVVNVAGATTTSLVAGLKRWRIARLAAAAAAAEVLALAEAALPTEMTALLAGHHHAESRALKTKTSESGRAKRDM